MILTKSRFALLGSKYSNILEFDYMFSYCNAFELSSLIRLNVSHEWKMCVISLPLMAPENKFGGGE